MPAITAPVVASRRPSGASSPSDCMVFTTQPSSVRIVCHATVRTIRLVKNGRMISSSMRLRHRPALKAMKYASGNAMIRQRIVAVPAYSTDRTSWSVFSEIASG